MVNRQPKQRRIKKQKQKEINYSGVYLSPNAKFHSIHRSMSIQNRFFLEGGGDYKSYADIKSLVVI